MHTTTTETSDRTLTRLIAAMDHQHPVTISYPKEEKDDAGKKTGALVETVRTIETYDVTTTKAGNVLIVAMDRESGERRTFRLDRITAYTVHRTAYTVPRDTTALRPAGHGLAAATAALAPVHHLPVPAATGDRRVAVLANILAA